jgi:hypothetical protein
LVLSKEFVTKRYPMEELQKLLEHRRKGSDVRIVPVFYPLDYAGVSDVKEGYKTKLDSTSKLQPQWLEDLETLLRATSKVHRGGVVRVLHRHPDMWDAFDGRTWLQDGVAQSVEQQLEQQGAALEELGTITGIRMDQVHLRAAFALQHVPHAFVLQHVISTDQVSLQCLFQFVATATVKHILLVR